ncbi:MAG TPA: hypothetical protein VFS31_15075 [Chitinophagaceae bacterium]|jgi:hypothetical protein|nr:hypothetical protein [Chitinophagaceae bacterium]
MNPALPVLLSLLLIKTIPGPWVGTTTIPVTIPAVATKSLRQPGDATAWTADLIRFRTALLSHDKKTVKSFFHFPILDKGNDIWFVADNHLVTKLNQRETVPFTETDFDQYYNSILAIDFRKTLEKIDVNQLAKTHRAKSTEIEIVPGSKSFMIATWDQAHNLLTLEIFSKSPGFGQFSFQYHFTISNETTITFKEITVIM